MRSQQTQRRIIALSFAGILPAGCTSVINQNTDGHQANTGVDSSPSELTDGESWTGGASDGGAGSTGQGKSTSDGSSTGQEDDTGKGGESTGAGDGVDTSGDPDSSGGQGSTTGADTSTGGSGDNTNGGGDTGGGGKDQFPLDDEGIITDPPGGVYAVSVALGWGANYILMNTGQVKAWGFGDYGQLGYGNTNTIYEPSKAGFIDLGFKAKQIVAGYNFACALAADGQPEEGCARCWGYDSAGNLGRGKIDAKNPNIGDDEMPAAAPIIKLAAPIVKLVAGARHVCALLSDETMSCWGAAGYGQLGYGDNLNIGDNELPGAKGSVDVGWPVADIAAGGSNTCAIRADGVARCWGRFLASPNGPWINIGDDELPSSQPPIDFGFSIKQLALGYEQICALASAEDDNLVKCIGTGGYAKLGYGNQSNQTDPAAVEPVPLSIKPVWIDTMHVHTCVIDDIGQHQCWGWGEMGALGYASPENVGDDDTAVDWGTVVSGLDAVRIYTGVNQTCILDESSDLQCWGGNHGHPNYWEPVGDNETPASVGLVDYL